MMTPRPWMMPALLVLLLGLAATPASADPVACKRAVEQSTAKFVQAKMKALQKCNDAVVSNVSPGPCPDAKASAKIAKAETKLRTTIDGKCGGLDHSCGTGGDDESLASIGWNIGTCPNFENGACNNAIANCDDVSQCLVCIGEKAVDQAIQLYYGSLDQGASASDVIGCQRSIGKNTGKFFAAKSKALQKCEDGVIKGTVAGPCPDAVKAAPAIAKAESKKRAGICKACGGADRSCGGGDDLTPTQIGFTSSCPSVTIPGGASCAHAITTVQDIVDCVDCVTEFKADCIDALTVPELKSYPSQCNTNAPTPLPTVTPTPTSGGGGPTVTPTPGGGGGCPTSLSFEADGSAADLDTGWTGQSHDSKVINNGKLTLAVSGCGSPAPSCGQCNLNGPIANAGGTASNNHRCVGDTSIQCTTDGDCGANAPCAFFFGAPLPLSSGGVSVCVVNQVTSAVTGTADLVSGNSATSVNLLSRVHNGPTVDQPCPVCGTGGFGTTSTCSSGPRAGLACTVNGTSALFGSTSYDCTPLPGANVGNLQLGLNLSTGLTTRTLSAANPGCTAPGFTSEKCFCNTCNGPGVSPCATNADCPISGGNPGICGGKRCKGGSNVGAPCTVNSECPSSACGTFGKATQPNECDDGTCSPNTPPDNDSVNEGICNAGPFEQFCAIQSYRGCAANSDCPAPGDTCTNGRFRQCFTDNGAIGGSVQAQGMPDPPVNNVAHPKLGSLFCIPPTAADAVNSVAGLPGLGRLTLPGTGVFVVPGQPTPTPTPVLTATRTITPTPTVTRTPTPTMTIPGLPTSTPTGVVPTPGCGNGVLDAGEACDPNPNTVGGTCNWSQCIPPGASAGDAFACTCATGQLRTIYDQGRLDNGWTGTSQNTQTVSNTDFDALLFDCDGVTDTLCRLTGPRPGQYGFRCELNARQHCVSDADCAPSNGRCGGFLGAPLPLSSGGVPVCVTSFFPRPITGTLNVADGSTDTFTFLLSRVHLATAVDAPCARCCTTPLCNTESVGSTGTCTGGASAGQTCTVQGLSKFGPVSRDCPPDNAANISGGGLDIRFLPTTTGLSEKTASLPCTAAVFTQFNTCACDTCAGGTAANGPCSSDADCPGGGTCGATRCIGGSNDGQQCSSASACPGTNTSCGRPGLATKPNGCNFACVNNPANSCTVDSDCPGSSCAPVCVQDDAPAQIGLGHCGPQGPTTSTCSIESFRGCTTAADCNPPTCVGSPGTCSSCACGQTCDTAFQLCHVFPMELMGQPNPFSANTSSGMSVNTFCIPPTTATAVNSTSGLPGEGAILVTHHFTKQFPSTPCTGLPPNVTCP